MNSEILVAKFPRLLSLTLPYTVSKAKSYTIVVCMKPLVTLLE